MNIALGRFEVPAVCMRRADLLSILLAALPGECLRLGYEFERLKQVSGKVRLDAGAIELKQFAAAIDGASAMFDGRIGEPRKPAQLELMVNAQMTRGAGLAAFGAVA